MIGRAVAGVAALLLTAPIAARTEAAAPARPTVAVAKSAYGPVLFDGRGFALYAFTRDRARRTACSGACAKAWPPYIAPGALRAGRDAQASLLSTIRRPDGSKQVTYAGRPLYYYAGDRKPRQILCQNVFEFGGRWLVVRSGGATVG
ncbi:MAG: hypothetical protein QOD37_76 [Gaiellales bacterium]|nr:hypothetical protein [Gaiellales bacterium]